WAARRNSARNERPHSPYTSRTSSKVSKRAIGQPGHPMRCRMKTAVAPGQPASMASTLGYESSSFVTPLTSPSQRSRELKLRLCATAMCCAPPICYSVGRRQEGFLHGGIATPWSGNDGHPRTTGPAVGDRYVFWHRPCHL